VQRCSSFFITRKTGIEGLTNGVERHPRRQLAFMAGEQRV
jgi:hypothetical protein